MSGGARLLTSTVRGFVSRHRALGGVLVIGLALRLRGLTEWWLNPDEGIYYSILTRADFAGFWQEVTTNAHPPLYYLILRGFGALTWDFLWFRAFSVICGLAAIVAVWVAARELARGAMGSPTDGAPTEEPGEPDSITTRRFHFDEDAGLLAALVIAISPGAIELSQVMRPYMLLLALLASALFCLLRYRNGGSGRALVAYMGLVSLALLTHYSAVLALGVFGLLVLYEGARRGLYDARWQRMAFAQAIPGILFLSLYFFHVRALSGTDLAADALAGWLSPYMIDAPGDVWFAYLGFQYLVAIPWLMGPAALFTLWAIAWSAVGRDRTLAVVAGGGLLVAITVASIGVYPLGATRHSSWLLGFTAPAIGWLGGRLLWSARIRSQRFLPAAAILLLAIGGPVGVIIGVPKAPWAPTDQVLRVADLTQMIEFLDPAGEPEMMVMSAQTFYLFLPLYPKERETATESADGSLFHFTYGRRKVLVSRAWNFTAGEDRTAGSHLARVFPEADEAFPELRLREREPLVLLVGGWRPPFVDELLALANAAPIGSGLSAVPGLYAFELDMPPLLHALRISMKP